MTVEKLDSLEERIQKPGYLLLLVVVLLLLIVGFVDLIDTTSNNPVIFGRYSLPYFIVLIIYALVTVAWASLLLRPNNDRWLTKTLDFIQQHPFLALLLLAGITLIIVFMVVPKQRVHKNFLSFPALQVAVIVILLLAAGLILFYKWADKSRPQWWRKIVVAVLLFLLLVEIIIQLLAPFGLLPSLTTTRDAFAPYARVYQSEEGLGSGTTNGYGRYTTEFRLLPDSHRVAIMGSTAVQALQVERDQNVGVQLENRIAEGGTTDQVTEVLTIGYPDYGPGMYLSNWMLNVVARDFEPNQAIIFWDLGRDFQEVDGPGQGQPYFQYQGGGRSQLNLEQFFTDLHNAEHVVYQGHEGFQLIRILGSQYLTPRVIARLLAEPQAAAAAQASPTNINTDIDRPEGFLFNAATNGEAMRIASSLIYMADEQLGRSDIATSLVTIPAFSEDFYQQSTWNTRFGDSDLLLPESKLRATAANFGLPFLGLGTYMASQGMTPAEVQQLYYEDGLGHFTTAGHEFAAQATYECFFAQTLTAEEGCDLR